MHRRQPANSLAGLVIGSPKFACGPSHGAVCMIEDEGESVCHVAPNSIMLHSAHHSNRNDSNRNDSSIYG
jgi:hypothetical protein